MEKIVQASLTHRTIDPLNHRLTDSPSNRAGLLFIIATIPLPYASVQPVVWSVYAGLIFFLFIYGLWCDKLDFQFTKSPLLIFSLGLFMVYTLLQVVPLPVGVLRFLNPFQYRVIQQSAFLLGESSSWHSISYVSSASFAWWIFLLSLFLFFGLLRSYLASSRNLIVLVGIIIGVALVEALYGLMQALIPTLGIFWSDTVAVSDIARGTFINRNHFAGFLEMAWLVGLGLILVKARLWNKDNVHTKALSRTKQLKIYLSSDTIGFQLVMISALLFILLALLFSKSRAGITGAFIGFLAYALLCRLGGQKLSRVAGVTMGLGVVFLIVYGGMIGFDQIIARFLAIDDSAGSRGDIWKDTIAIIKGHPFGIGLGNYEHVMPVFNAHGPYGIKYLHAHNDYLQLLAETGWPGFIALVGGFYVFLGKMILRIRRFGSRMNPESFYIQVGAISGLISIAFHSFFDFNLQIPANMLYFVVLMAIAASDQQRARSGAGEPEVGGRSVRKKPVSRKNP
jgi:O-antigen ligase